MLVYMLFAAVLGTVPGVTSQRGLEIQGVFSVHQGITPGQLQCSREINEPQFLLYEAFLWRIQTTASDLLDICGNTVRLQSTIEQPPNYGKMVAYVGPSDDEFVDEAAKSYERMEQVSILTSWSVPDFNSHQPPYRFVHSIAPTVSKEANAMIDVITSQSWPAVVLVYIDDRYGNDGVVRFESVAAENRIAVSQKIRLWAGMSEDDLRASIGEIREVSDTRILAVFAYVSHIEYMWRRLRENFIFISPVSFGEYLYRTPSRLGDYTGMITLRAGFNDTVIDEIHAGFTAHILSNRIPNMDELFREFWEEKFRCNLQHGTNRYTDSCSSNNQSLSDITIPAELPLVYLATESLVAAARDTCIALNMRCINKTNTVQDRLLNSTVSRIQTTKNRLLGLTDDSGIKVVIVDKTAFQEVTTKGQGRTILLFYNMETNSWAPAFKPRDVIGVRYDNEWGLRYDDYKHGWAIALAVFASLGLICTIALVIAYIIFRKHIPLLIVHFVLLVGLFLGFLTLFVFLPLPTKATCGIIRFGVGFSYAICFAALLLIALYWMQGKVELSRYRLILAFIGCLAVGVELTILIMWLIMVEPMAVQILDNRGVNVWICNHFTSETNDWASFERTGFENHLLALIYIMLLIFVILLLALWGLFAGRADPIRFPKKQNIILTIMIAGVIIIWLIWTLTGGLLHHADYAHEIADGCLGFGLFLTLLWIMLSFNVPVLWLTLRKKRMISDARHIQYGIEETKGINGGPTNVYPHKGGFDANGETHRYPQDTTFERNIRSQIIEAPNFQDQGNRTFQDQGLGVSVDYDSDDGQPVLHTKHMSRSAVELPRGDNVDSRYIDHRGQIYHHYNQPNITMHHRSAGDLMHHRSAGDLAYTSRRHGVKSEGGYEYDPRCLHLKHPRSMVDGGGSIIAVPADSRQMLTHETSFAQSEPPVILTDRYHGTFNPMYAGRSAASLYSAPNTVYYHRYPTESLYSHSRVVSSNGPRYYRPASESEYSRRRHSMYYTYVGQRFFPDREGSIPESRNFTQ